MNKIKNVLILHDYFHVNGGAEKLVTILKNKIQAKIIVGWINKNYIYSDGLDKVDVLCNLPLIPRVIQVFLRFLFKIKNINNYDVVIYSGVFSILNSVYQKKGKKIYYCHTLPRFIYKMNENYLNRFNYLLRPFVKLAFSIYKRLFTVYTIIGKTFGQWISPLITGLLLIILRLNNDAILDLTTSFLN